LFGDYSDTNVDQSIRPLLRSGRPSVLTNETLAIIDLLMQRDDETTAKQLVLLLSEMGISISRSCALKGRQLLGWTL